VYDSGTLKLKIIISDGDIIEVGIEENFLSNYNFILQSDLQNNPSASSHQITSILSKGLQGFFIGLPSIETQYYFHP
jgi:hypothetical protein